MVRRLLPFISGGNVIITMNIYVIITIYVSPESVAELVEHRFPMRKVWSSNPS